mgnify:CR=1 FL=1
MIDNFNFKTGKPASKTRVQHRRILERLGPEPDLSLRSMTGYGLSDVEIAKYYGITPASVRRLKSILAIEDYEKPRD